MGLNIAILSVKKDVNILRFVFNGDSTLLSFYASCVKLVVFAGLKPEVVYWFLLFVFLKG